MGTGHFGVALALKKANPKINVGVLFFAAMFFDFLLGVLVLAGVEQVIVPANFAQLHFLNFNFPYSHGLLSSILWSAAAFLIVKLVMRKDPVESTRAGWIMTAAVFSHFILDFIVHIPELPLAGQGSLGLGLGLWLNMPVALGLEVLIVIAGVVIYLSAVPKMKTGKKIGLVVMMALLTLLTVVGQAFATSAPPPTAAAISWIGQSLLVSAIAFWLDREVTPVSEPALMRG